MGGMNIPNVTLQNPQDEADFNYYYQDRDPNERMNDLLRASSGGGHPAAAFFGQLGWKMDAAQRGREKRAAEQAAAQKAAADKAAADKAVADKAAADKAAADKAAANRAPQSNLGVAVGAAPATATGGGNMVSGFAGADAANPSASGVGFGAAAQPTAASSTGFGSGFIDTAPKADSLASVMSNAVGGPSKSGGGYSIF